MGGVTGPSVGSLVGGVTGLSVGSLVGGVVGTSVGSLVGGITGPSVGSLVGGVTGPSVGSLVGGVTGPSVGSLVGGVVGTTAPFSHFTLNITGAVSPVPSFHPFSAFHSNFTTLSVSPSTRVCSALLRLLYASLYFSARKVT